MATGDLKRSLRKLEQVLRLLNYPNEVDYVGLMRGDTAASLPIISYSLTSYSPYIAELLMESNVELIAKNDVRFTDTVYKLLRDQFDYKPILTKKQFIQSGFAEWKIQIVCDVLNCVMKKHKELIGSDKNPSCPKKRSIPEKPDPCLSSEIPTVEAVGIDITGRFMTSGKKKAVVIRHLYTEDSADMPEGSGSSAEVSEGCEDSEQTSDVMTAEEQASDVAIPEEQASDVKTELKDVCDNPEIIALQIALAECQEKLKRLTWVEERLECLEATARGKVMVEEKAWNNLLSRVTLLETELLLSKKNECVELNAASEDYDSVSGLDNVPVPFDKQYSMGAAASTYRSSSYSAVSPESTPRDSTLHHCGLKDYSQETTIQKMERMKKMFEETAELLKCSSR